MVEFREHRSRLGLDHGPLGIGAGKGPDRVERVPESDGEEFGAPAHVSSQQIGAAMAGNVSQRGQHRCRGVPLIGVGLRCVRRAAPQSSDHRNLA